MKRSIVVVPALVTATLGVAAPAHAASPPPDFSRLSSSATTCTPDSEGETCTSITVFAGEGSDGAGSVELYVFTSRVVDGETVHTVGESGSAPTRGLSLDRALNATLAPTTVPLQTCDDEGVCEPSRTVQVAVAETAVTAVRVARHRSEGRDGNCRYRYEVETRTADTAGALTFDGLSHESSGTASTEDVRERSRCR